MNEVTHFRTFIENSVEALSIAENMSEEPCVVEMVGELDQTEVFLFVYLDSVQQQLLKDIKAIINTIDAGSSLNDAIGNAPEFTFSRRGMNKAWDELCDITGEEYHRRGGAWADEEGFPLTAIGQAIAKLARGTSQ